MTHIKINSLWDLNNGTKKMERKKEIMSTLWQDCGDQNDNGLKKEDVANRSWYLMRRMWYN
jgi:hypothetical protein